MGPRARRSGGSPAARHPAPALPARWRRRRARRPTPPPRNGPTCVTSLENLALLDVRWRRISHEAGVGARVLRALEQAGVTQVAPDGVPFDPQQHHAVDRLPTHDPAQHNTVMTDRAGWVDGGRVLRLPDVIVYRNE